MADDLKLFLCRFPYDGSEWMIEVYARDFDDAQRRLERIGTHGKVDGIAVAKISVMAGGFLVPLVARVMNWWHRKAA